MHELGTWVARAQDAMRRRFRGEAGQGSVEYVGIIIVVVAIIVAVVAVAPTVGEAIGTQLQNAVESIGGEGDAGGEG